MKNLDFDLGTLSVTEEWREQPSMANHAIGITISDFEIASAREDRVTFMHEQVLRKMNHAIQTNVPGCAGCPKLQMNETLDPVSANRRLSVKCKHYGETKINCPNGTTLIKRGVSYGVVSYKAPPLSLATADVPLDRIAPMAKMIKPGSLPNPDAPTTVAETW